MIEEVKIEIVAPRLFAAVRERIFSADEFTPKVIASLDKVWAFIRADPSIRHEGINIAVYWHSPTENLLQTPAGLPMDCGVAIPAPFADSPPIRCLATPGGRALKATLIGPYNQIPAAHAAAHEARRARNLTLAGPCWEVYGHWTNDPAKLTTEIFYLLA